MAKFEVVNRFAGDADLLIPTRGTANSAGYDFIVAENTLIRSYPTAMAMTMKMQENFKRKEGPDDTFFNDHPEFLFGIKALAEKKEFDNIEGIKPTLVSSGVKCKLDPGTYLELSVRSSTPLKYGLVLANSVGVIDADYYNNPDNEGEIFFQLLNFSPYDILLKKGDRIGQGIIKPYLTTEDDTASGARMGGFGSTGYTAIPYTMPTSSNC